MNYEQIFNKSIQEPAAFWLEQAKHLSWYEMPKTALKSYGDYPIWFPDGKLNICYLTVDKHIEDGFGEQTAIIYDSPVTQTVQHISFNELQHEVAHLAGALQNLGVEKGNTVIIYMPMIPQAVYAMLACARIGAVHSVVFGGFAANELAIRIDDCAPKVIITASAGIEITKIINYKPIVDEAIDLAAHKPQNVVLYDRKLGSELSYNARDLDYNELVKNAEQAPCVPVEAYHPLYILYTSGTTGKPKGIVRDTGGYATALLFSMRYVYDVNPGEVYWAASDVGWVVGHSYIVYGPLLNRNTTILFEGKPIKTPNASTFWRVIEQHRVSVMFTAPTAIRAIKKEDPEGTFIKKHDLSSLRYQFLAGERCDVATLEWYKQHIPIPAIDHWWQTESGWPMIANLAGVELLPIKPGSAGKAVPGYDIEILNDEGEKLGANQEGYVVVKLPLPPGTLLDIWNNNKRFKEGYLSKFPGYYFSGDGGYTDEDGYLYITGRVDDVINVAGHRLSTAEMEEIVAAHPMVAECAVVGINDELKGQIPLALVVAKTGNENDQQQVEFELIQAIRNKIGAVASLKNVVFVTRLPKTRSGKIIRKLIRQIFDGAAHDEIKVPPTIDDASVIGEIQEAAQTFKN